jgi:hypothetical protein
MAGLGQRGGVHAAAGEGRRCGGGVPRVLLLSKQVLHRLLLLGIQTQHCQCRRPARAATGGAAGVVLLLLLLLLSSHCCRQLGS